MSGVELPPCSLAWDGPILESAFSMVVLMLTSSKRTYANTPYLAGLLLPVPLTLWQATVNLHLCRRLPHTHRQVWLSLLLGHCSFPLSPVAPRFSLCLPRVSVSLNSVQFSRSVVSDSLRPHEPQHARLPCLSPTPGVHPNPCPSSRWCHPAISSSVILFSSCPQSFPASGSFQMSQLFASGGQSIWVSASTSVLPMNTQDWSALGWTDLLIVKGTPKSLLQHHSSKASILQRSAFFTVQLSHPYMTTGKTIALTRQAFVDKVIETQRESNLEGVCDL